MTTGWLDFPYVGSILQQRGGGQVLTGDAVGVDDADADADADNSLVHSFVLS